MLFLDKKMTVIVVVFIIIFITMVIISTGERSFYNNHDLALVVGLIKNGGVKYVV